MWNRLTESLADIVAPEEEVEQEQDDTGQLWSRIASVVAPLPTSPNSAEGGRNDEDEQDQYICDLERALLQRKTHNEALENKVDRMILFILVCK